MKRNETFNTAAELYDEVRPTYDQLVIDWIIQKTRVTVDDQLLEIGPGTGQATMRFAEAGFKIHCVELGENLAAILKQKCEHYPGVTVDISAFETWQSDRFTQFTLIYSASFLNYSNTNGRWTNPRIVFSKASSHNPVFYRLKIL